MPPRSTRVPAYIAAVLAFGSAAVSLYWTLGGTVLLDTVGGTFEDLARERSSQSIVLGMLVVLVKGAGGLLALALVQPWGTHVGRRLLPDIGRFGKRRSCRLRRSARPRWWARARRPDHPDRTGGRACIALACVRLGPLVSRLGHCPGARCLAVPHQRPHFGSAGVVNSSGHANTRPRALSRLFTTYELVR